MMNPIASTNKTSAGAPANAASSFDAAVATTAMRIVNDQRTNPSPPSKLEGVYKFIQPLVKTQQEKLQNTMVCKSKTMLNIKRKIRR